LSSPISLDSEGQRSTVTAGCRRRGVESIHVDSWGVEVRTAAPEEGQPVCVAE